MLKIQILTPGKDKEAWITTACDNYIKLLSRSASVELKHLPALKNGSALSPEQYRAAEYELFAPALARKGAIIALSERGELLTSDGFAKLLEKLQTTSGGLAQFLIGGAHGLDDRLLTGADLALSLSPLTFTHQMVRVILLEQLYRGFSILSGSSYHK